MKLADLKIDDDFKNLLPELDAETYTALEKDIVSNGVLDPIITWNGFIADGHNRYSICKAHHIEEIQTKPLKKATKSDVMQWIVDHQFAKRNLTKSEQIRLLAKVEAQIAKEAATHTGGRPKKEEKPTANLPQVSEKKKRNDTTAGQMAKKIGVSEKTYRDMKTIVEKGTPEQIKRMDKGGVENGVSTIAREIRDGVKDGERKCIKCNRILPVANFRDKRHRYVCLECENERKRESARRNSEKLMVMPDTLNPDVKEDITDDIIVAKFKNILAEATDTFETMLKYEQHMTDAVMDELINVINEHINKMNEVKEKMANETEGKTV